MLIFLALTAWVVYCGVEKGIEKYSRYIMPGLLLLIIGIAIFSLTLSYTDESGMTRTGIEGLLVYIKPDFTGLTVQRFLNIALDAMSQLFFSLSVSMGIMITYGSYVKDDVDLNKANNQIEIFDTGVAFLAGLMIIPAVYVFLGTDGMASGPSLTFISLPKVFAGDGRRGPRRGRGVLPRARLRRADELRVRHGDAWSPTAWRSSTSRARRCAPPSASTLLSRQFSSAWVTTRSTSSSRCPTARPRSCST